MSEVALGKQLNKLNADGYLNGTTLAKQKCNSTKGVGKWEPSKHIMIDDIKMPNGKLHVANTTTTLRYNEHIIYNVEQQLIRYLILVKNVGGYGGY